MTLVQNAWGRKQTAQEDVTNAPQWKNSRCMNWLQSETLRLLNIETIGKRRIKIL